MKIKEKCCNIQQKEITKMKNTLHNIICSISCDEEKHKKTGFSTILFSNFSIEDIFEQIKDGVKQYIDIQSIIF